MIGKTLFFTTENEAIAGLYRDRYGIKTSILPVPFGDTPPAAPCSGRPIFGFFGYSKCDKGFHLLPEAIEICRAHGLDANLTIQLQHSGWGAGDRRGRTRVAADPGRAPGGGRAEP